MSFLDILLHALQHSDLDNAISEGNAKERGFDGLKTLLVFYCSLSSVCFGFLVSLSLQLPLCRVEGYLQVFGANEASVVRVLTQSVEHINIVAPKGNVCDAVASSEGNLVG